jgi:NAD+ synthase (glutamine-hydrolysing)
MSEFRIAAAQIASLRGDLDGNIRVHAAAITAAAARGVLVLVCPELSLIGYEPELAAELAISATDERLAPLAALAVQHQMAVVVGASLRTAGPKPALGAIRFAANGSTRTYAKIYLGGSEPDYFAAGGTPLSFASQGQTIGLAICADTSQPSHPQAYADTGTTIYAASVFLNAESYAARLAH